jgi:hypothetical protein
MLMQSVHVLRSRTTRRAAGINVGFNVHFVHAEPYLRDDWMYTAKQVTECFVAVRVLAMTDLWVFQHSSTMRWDRLFFGGSQ